MDSLSINEIKERGLLLFECISGSRAYGTQVPGSDTDYKGVYMAPPEQFFGLQMTDQVNEDNNDKAYYELGKYLELLSKSNPNMLEMLNVPADCLLYKHPLMDLILPELFITKTCKDTFAGYAKTQIRKARGLKKKILNPVEPTRKTVLDFCYVVQQHHSIPLRDWLEKEGFDQSECGLVNINHARDLYALYHSTQGLYQGVVTGNEANDVSYSSVPKDAEVLGHLVFNKDGYKTHCKDYKEYWSWVKKRNELRYENTLAHGKRYDSKNMMHTFRLLHMAEEIGREGAVHVRRSDRDFLLQIRKGDFEFEELLAMADQKIEDVEAAFKASKLPEKVNLLAVNSILQKIRTNFYASEHLD